MTSQRPPCRRVAVIGAGWAGATAALELARRGVAVTVFERAQVAGGRARRVVVDGVPLDNGQHLMLGAYAECLRVIGSLHPAVGASALLERVPLALLPWGRQPGAARMRAWKAPAPFHLAGALIGARGLRVAARVALAARVVRNARAPARVAADATVAAWWHGLPDDAYAGVIEPLCVAALNTPAARASARVFANVLAAAFAGARSHSDFIIPTTDLSALLPEPALREVVDRGGELRLGTTARVVAADASGVRVNADRGNEAFAAAVVAVGPHQLAGALAEAVTAIACCGAALAMTRAFDYEPIATVYLGFAGDVPMRAPVQRLDDRPGQWLFARRQPLPDRSDRGAASLLAVVISATAEGERLDQRALAAAVQAQLRRLDPALPEPGWSRVITERRATYACTPGLARPVAGLLAPGLAIAGDYTDPDFPATLEAATRSGRRAAEALLAQRDGAPAGRGRVQDR